MASPWSVAEEFSRSRHAVYTTQRPLFYSGFGRGSAPTTITRLFFSIDSWKVKSPVTIAPWFLNEPRPTIQLWQVFVHNSNNFTLRLRRDCESCWKRKKRKKGRKEGEISFARCAHFNSNFHLEFIIPHNAIVTVVLYLLV